MGDGENFFFVLNKKNRIMSTCQYQSTRYQTYDRDDDPNSDNYGSYTSTSKTRPSTMTYEASYSSGCDSAHQSFSNKPSHDILVANATRLEA